MSTMKSRAPQPTLRPHWVRAQKALTKTTAFACFAPSLANRQPAPLSPKRIAFAPLASSPRQLAARARSLAGPMQCPPLSRPSPPAQRAKRCLRVSVWSALWMPRCCQLLLTAFRATLAARTLSPLRLMNPRPASMKTAAALLILLWCAPLATNRKTTRTAAAKCAPLEPFAPLGQPHLYHAAAPLLARRAPL